MVVLPPYLGTSGSLLHCSLPSPSIPPLSKSSVGPKPLTAATASPLTSSSRHHLTSQPRQCYVSTTSPYYTTKHHVMLTSSYWNVPKACQSQFFVKKGEKTSFSLIFACFVCATSAFRLRPKQRSTIQSTTKSKRVHSLVFQLIPQPTIHKVHCKTQVFTHFTSQAMFFLPLLSKIFQSTQIWVKFTILPSISAPQPLFLPIFTKKTL